MEEQSRNSTYSLIEGPGLPIADQVVCMDLTEDDYLLYSCVKLYLQLNQQNLSISEPGETGGSLGQAGLEMARGLYFSFQ